MLKGPTEDVHGLGRAVARRGGDRARIRGASGGGLLDAILADEHPTAGAVPVRDADTLMDGAARRRRVAQDALALAEAVAAERRRPGSRGGGGMSLVVVLPVKALDRAKARLGEAGVGAADRVALATGMLTDVLEALERSRLVDDVVVVSGDPRIEVIARGYGNQVIAEDPDGGHPRRRAIGAAWALDEGAFHALLLAGDTPAIDPEEIDALADMLADGPEVVIVPDRHGTGTNALLLTPARRDRRRASARAAVSATNGWRARPAPRSKSPRSPRCCWTSTPQRTSTRSPSGLADRRASDTAVYTRAAMSRVRRRQ